MTQIKIIGLSGRADSGKTTVARYLVEQYGFVRTAFGDALKTMLLDAGMCTREELWGDKTPHSRWLLQKVGTDIFRKQVDPKYWVRRTAAEVHRLRVLGHRVVIDDIRFPEEAALIRAYLNYGILIKLERVGHVDATAGTTHASESLVDTIETDYTISAASGDVAKLLRVVDEIIGERP